jgi:hypothetical protein
MRLRAHFYDTMRERGVSPAHWIGLKSQYGSVAIGLGGDCANCYAFLNGRCPDGSPDQNCWQATQVARSEGWHSFEVHLDGNTLSVIVDGELVAMVPTEGRDYGAEEVWLVAKRGGVGHWAAVELLHTPPSCTPPSQGLAIGDRHLWQVDATQKGRWQIVDLDGEMVVQGEEERVTQQTAQTIPEPLPVLVVEPPPAPAGRPATAAGGLTIECWSLPGEADLERIERVVGVFVEQLVAAGVTMPENFERVGRCGARTDPQPCHIYRFGTRRLHLNIREAAGGRLCLVVRCGGGFLDFAEFARKNGSVEQLKLLRMQRQPTQGRQVLQLASVYQKGQRQVKEVNTFNSTTQSLSSRRGRAQ